MKLKIKETLLIGDPNVGAEIEIKTNGKIFDIEVVKEQMSFQGMDFGIRPAIIKVTTTSSQDYKNWEILDTFGVDTGYAGIWDADAPEDSEWSKQGDLHVSNKSGEFCNGIITISGLGDGSYCVYVKRKGDAITDFVIDFRD